MNVGRSETTSLSVKPEQVTYFEDNTEEVFSQSRNSCVNGNNTMTESVDRKDDERNCSSSSSYKDVGPPPFLKKIYEMVEDSETDTIVGWSENRDSFVVFDSHQFSKLLLPKYFKHSNFSSFIRQLNTYGFRKIDSERWEFANDGFQGGKKHLLKNIRRRSKYNKLHQLALSSMKPCLEAEVEKLKKDQNIMKHEILKLRQQQENSHMQLTNVQERIQTVQVKHHQIIVFLIRMCRKPFFVDQLIHTIKRKRELDGNNIVKKHRLLEPQCPLNFPNAMETSAHNVEQFTTLQSDIIGLLSESVNTNSNMGMDDELCSHVQGLRTYDSRTNGHDVSSAYDVVSEKLMRENSVVHEEQVDVNDSNIYLELEDLISKPGEWVGSESGLVGQIS